MSEEAFDLFEKAAGWSDTFGARYVRSMYPSIIRQGLDEGLSGSQILGGMRGVGLGIRTQRFYELLGNVRAGIGAEQATQGVDLDQAITVGDTAPWEVGRSLGGFLYRAQLHYVVRDEAGNIVERGVRPFSLRNSTLVTWGEAIQDMADVISGGPGEGTPPHEVLGIEPVAIYQLVT